MTGVCKSVEKKNEVYIKRFLIFRNRANARTMNFRTKLSTVATVNSVNHAPVHSFVLLHSPVAINRRHMLHNFYAAR